MADDELDRLIRCHGRAWAALIEASGSTWHGGRFCAPDGHEGTTLAALARARVGIARVGEILAGVEAAETALRRHHAAAAKREARLREGRVA